ncbi:transcription factor Moc3 [Schizosaccharomyces japonicus yFS275]|uniref:Transcription factor Moc3 n=1 Tax=Schizosaccharomyces japonicus (strain yFS275 / FY16936) TaxID=402676 RepID=B6JW92_SCHJY|nr:transcription factor Moc3 [Schizosaccharomyces japonicus yFS275]EEB05643.2 transcription factor Moc3 [Schizosaccharomyces japonicus yFS275]
MNHYAYPETPGKRFRPSLPGTMSKQTSPVDKPVKRRTKTGCFTCRRRRIKCDEAKPYCMNCTKSNRKCEGYAVPVPSAAHPLGNGSPPDPTAANAAVGHPVAIAGSIVPPMPSPSAGDNPGGVPGLMPNELPQLNHPQAANPMAQRQGMKPMAHPLGLGPLSAHLSNPNAHTINPNPLVGATAEQGVLNPMGSSSFTLPMVPPYYAFNGVSSSFSSYSFCDFSPFYFYDVVPSLWAFDFDHDVALQLWSVVIPQLARSVSAVAYSLMAFTSIKRLDVYNAYTCMVQALRAPQPDPGSLESKIIYSFLAVTQLHLPGCDITFINNAIRKILWSTEVKIDYLNTLLAMVTRELVFAVLQRRYVPNFDGMPLAAMNIVRSHASISDSLFNIALKIVSQPMVPLEQHREKIIEWRDRYHVNLYSNAATPLAKVLDCVGHAVTKNDSDLLHGLQQLMSDDCSNVAVVHSAYTCVLSLQNVFPPNSPAVRTQSEIESFFGKRLLVHLFECSGTERMFNSVNKSNEAVIRKWDGENVQ